MHSCAQWWFVRTRPFSETKLAEQPPARRADESRAFSSQASLGRNPYFFSTLSLGNASYVHMPSSAAATSGESRASATTRLFMLPSGRVPGRTAPVARLIGPAGEGVKEAGM